MKDPLCPLGISPLAGGELRENFINKIMTILDGKKLRDDILVKVKKEIATLSFVPIFCDVLVGEDPSSLQYVQMKGRTAEAVGIKFHKANFPASISTEDLIKEIQILNKIHSSLSSESEDLALLAQKHHYVLAIVNIALMMVFL